MRLTAILYLFVAGVLFADDAAPISYRLENRAGRLLIRASTGDVVSWQAYGLSADISLEDWQAKQPALIRSGVTLFQITWNPGEKHPGEWDNPFSTAAGEPASEPGWSPLWDEKAAYLIEQVPEARFLIRFDIAPSLTWRTAHPDHYSPVPQHRGGISLRPSLGSPLFREMAAQNVRDVIRWCESRPWRDRIVGYCLFPYGEGITEEALFGDLFDTSPIMQTAFRDAMRAKYGTEEALRQGWNDPEITFDTLAVPTQEEWLAKRDRLGLLHWPDPAQVQRERDYFRLRQQLFHQFWTAVFDALAEATAERPVIKTVDAFKQPLQGWLLNADFFATWKPGTMDNFGQALLGSGSLGVAPLLDHPGLDMLTTPAMYTNRAIGYAWEGEGLTDSLVLRGKLNYVEADMRTYVRLTWRGKPLKEDETIKDFGVFMTPAEVAAGFHRTLAWALTRNQMYYYMSVCGANWWFHDAPIEAVVAEQAKVIDRAAALPWAETADAICLVIDDEASLYEDFSGGYQNLAVYRQLEEGLALAGVPYRIHLLADLARPDFPDYKCYLFPNLFKVDAATEALLRQKVFRRGHVAIFGPGTGIAGDGATLSAEPASRLLGVPMELTAKSVPRRVMLTDFGHPMSQRLGTLIYGDSYAYGPILAPKPQRLDGIPGATQLGTCHYYYFFDRPGPFIREFADYRVVWTPAVPLPPEFLRECARLAGIHLYTERNAVIYAANGLVAIHTTERGEHTLALPARTAVWDLLTGKRLARRTDRIRFTVDGPTTRILYLGSDLPE